MKKKPNVSRLRTLDQQMANKVRDIYERYNYIEGYVNGDASKKLVERRLLSIRNDVIKFLDLIADTIDELNNNPELPSRISQ